MRSTVRIVVLGIVVILAATLSNVLDTVVNTERSIPIPELGKSETASLSSSSSAQQQQEPPPPPRTTTQQQPHKHQFLRPKIVRYKIAKLPHTGSKTLHGLLNSHPHIRLFFEPRDVTQAIAWTMQCPQPCDDRSIATIPTFYTMKPGKWKQFCAAAQAPPNQVPAVACGYSINIFAQANPEQNDLPQDAFATPTKKDTNEPLLDDDNLLIVMSRLNVLEHALSAPMRHRVPGQKLHVNASFIEGKIERSLMAHRLVSHALTRLPHRTLFIWFYEDFVQRPKELMEHLLDFLGVQHMELRNFSDAKEALKGKAKGGNLDDNIENVQEIQELVQRMDPKLMPQFAGDWGRQADTRQAFRDLCAAARKETPPPQGRVARHRHLDTYCAADGTVVPMSSSSA